MNQRTNQSTKTKKTKSQNKQTKTKWKKETQKDKLHAWQMQQLHLILLVMGFVDNIHE